MERIRGAVCGLLLVLGLSLSPAKAMASEGFLGGLEDLTDTREVEVESYEERYQEEYEPDLSERESAPVRQLDENATTVDYVNDTLDSFNTVSWGGTTPTRTLLRSVLRFWELDTSGKAVLLASVGIVFGWWGVRKSKNMVMGAFRKGKASL